MTLQEWKSRPDLRNAWKEYSKSDSGKALKEVLFTLGVPVPVMAPPNVDFVDWNATLNARREGFFEALRLLTALADDPVKQDELPAPWEQTKTQ